MAGMVSGIRARYATEPKVSYLKVYLKFPRARRYATEATINRCPEWLLKTI